MREEVARADTKSSTHPVSEDALSVLVPMLEEIAEWDSTRIRALFDAHGFVLQDWQKVRTDSLTIRESAAAPPLAN